MEAQALIPFATLVIAPITAVITWWLSRRKETAVTHTTVAEGASVAVATILQVMQELKTEIVQISEEAEALRKENERLKAVVRELEYRVIELLRETGNVDD